MFWTAGCSLLRAEGFFCRYHDKKYHIFSAINFFNFWILIGIQPKILDPDPDSMNPHSKHRYFALRFSALLLKSFSEDNPESPYVEHTFTHNRHMIFFTLPVFTCRATRPTRSLGCRPLEAAAAAVPARPSPRRLRPDRPPPDPDRPPLDPGPPPRPTGVPIPHQGASTLSHPTAPFIQVG